MSSVQGALVTTDEGGLDTVFSQTSFSTLPIDIQFLPARHLISPDWLTIDNRVKAFRSFAKPGGGLLCEFVVMLK